MLSSSCSSYAILRGTWGWADVVSANESEIQPWLWWFWDDGMRAKKRDAMPIPIKRHTSLCSWRTYRIGYVTSDSLLVGLFITAPPTMDFHLFLSPSEDANQEKMKIRNVGCRWKSQENSRRSVCKIYQGGGDQIGGLLGKVGRGWSLSEKDSRKKIKINKKREQSRRWWRWIVWRRETFLLHEFWP